MEVADGPYNIQPSASNESPKTAPSGVRMSLGLPGEFPPSNMAIAYPERDIACTGSSNSDSLDQDTFPAPESISPLHGVASGRRIAFYRDGKSSAIDMDVGNTYNEGDLILHMANITLELLRELSTRNTEAHAEPTTGQQRRLHRFTQHAHRARRWLYRFAEQKGLAIARQQIQQLGQNLDNQAEPSPAMAGGARAIWVLAHRYPFRVRIPSTLALVMRFLPESIKRPINLRDREDLARAFVALARYWLSEASGEAALTTRGTTKQPAKAEEPGKSITAHENENVCAKSANILNQPTSSTRAGSGPNSVSVLIPPQLECVQLWIDEARIFQDYSFNLVTLVERMWGLTDEEVAFARLRIYGPFTVDWMQRAIPNFRPTQMVMAQWIVEHNQMMMECPKPGCLWIALHATTAYHARYHRKALKSLRLAAEARQSTASVYGERLGPDWAISLLYSRPTVECGDADGATMVAVPLAGAIARKASHSQPGHGHFPPSRTGCRGPGRAVSEAAGIACRTDICYVEDVMLYLQREKRVTDADLHYARRRLGLGQEHTKRLQTHGPEVCGD
ncbi:hypothetical protein AnigIFM63604_003473 [Aspergillus niger]|uniref:Uncharacterized protein n=1 Tax=Aspergillus niger TaxID=5061 RepID=A0A9W6ACV4_ASPNG|nr:hypothetical protein AnigIFM63604_003473 [Aspergillus niger]